MKTKIYKWIVIPIIAISISVLGISCSSDEPEEVETNSLITTFNETYGLCAQKTQNQYELKNLMIPIRGVDLDGQIIRGMKCTPTLNPLWYQYWINKYGDNGFKGNPKDFQDYHPHPYAITKITMYVVWDVLDDPQPWAPSRPGLEYNDNYQMGDDCTSLFRIRYRSYYDYIKNGYSWDGLGRNTPWYEMELTEFNAQGGAKLVDMTKLYLIAKEPPKYGVAFLKEDRPFKADFIFENGKQNYVNKHVRIFASF